MAEQASGVNVAAQRTVQSGVDKTETQPAKYPTAVALGRLGCLSRAARPHDVRLTPEQRAEAACKGVRVRWANRARTE